MNKFIEEVLNILKKDKRLFSKDDNKLLKGELISLISKDDEKLLELLASNKEIEKRFFKKVGKITIFQKENFLQLITMNEFLPDSFTAFEISIGLSSNKKLISSQEDISLVFPHKDCILEGGQDKEDVKREEVFFNTTLAPNEVDRLKEPKVLTNWKKFDSKGKQKIKEISKNDNLVIKGNNLLALYSLLSNYRNKVKLIYIDPPYNTGNDEFKYNDSFNHSSWLTFMKNRLEVAKEFLKDDGVIFVQCDEHEQAYLKIIMDEIFGIDNFINVIVLKSKASSGASGGGEDKKLKKNTEFINVYGNNNFKRFKDIYQYILLNEYIENLKDNDKNFAYTSVMVSDGKKEYIKSIKDGFGDEIKIYKHHNYKIESINKILKNEKISVDEAYNKYIDKIFTLENAQTSIRDRVLEATDIDDTYYTAEYIPKSGRNKNNMISVGFMGKTKRLVSYLNANCEIVKGKNYKKIKMGSLWDDISWSSVFNEGGVKLKNGKKPEKLLHRVIDMSTEKNDIVLDFFAGSGTTGAVAHKMGRQYLLVEQMDYIHELPEKRLINVINGDKTGVSKIEKWTGGGSFVYTELLEWNNKYIRELESAKTKIDIKKIKTKIEKEAFYKYQIDTTKFDNKEFDKLSEKEQKEVLIDVLDMNHLYVNIDSINDATFAVSKEDKELNKRFYNQK